MPRHNRDRENREGEDSRRDNRGGNRGGNVQVTVGIVSKTANGFVLQAFARKGGAIKADEPVVFLRNGEPEVGGVKMTSRADGSATWNYKFPGGFKEGVTATVEVAGAAPKSVTVNPPPEASEASGPKKIIPRIEVEETVLSPERTAEGRYAGTICVFNEDTEESMAANLTFRAGKPVAYQSFRNPVKNGVMIWTDKVSAGGHLFFDLVVTERTQIDIFVDGFSSRKFQLNIPFEGVAQTAQRGFGRGWS